jgi:hypothetical protein
MLSKHQYLVNTLSRNRPYSAKQIIDLGRINSGSRRARDTTCLAMTTTSRSLLDAGRRYTMQKQMHFVSHLSATKLDPNSEPYEGGDVVDNQWFALAKDCLRSCRWRAGHSALAVVHIRSQELTRARF